MVVEGLSEHTATSAKHVLQLLRRGRRNRFTAATELNELSSRSHAVVVLVVQQHEELYLGFDGQSALLRFLISVVLLTCVRYCL